MVLKQFFDVYRSSSGVKEAFKQKGILSIEFSEHEPDRHKESLVQELRARVESDEAAKFLISQLAMPSQGYKLMFIPPAEKLFVAKLFKEPPLPHALHGTEPLKK